VAAAFGIARNYLLPGAISVLVGNGDGTFKTQVSYATGAGSHDVIALDVNGDGVLDLVAANGDDDTASVLIGSGDARFSVGTALPDSVSQAVVAADLNGDGLLDLATVDANTSMDIFLGTQGGKFSPGQAYVAGTNPQSLAIGDFNGDGIPDAAIVSTNNDKLNILLGNGDGTFTRGDSHFTGVIPLSVVAADFNGDGVLDLAVANFDSFNIGIYIGNGDGTFRDPVVYSTGNGLQPIQLAVGDFNHDGYPDLVSSINFGFFVSVLLNDKTGHFGSPINVATSDISYTVAVGDFNGDGNADIVMGTNGTSGVTILLGNGDATFQAPVDYPLDNLASVSSVAVADVDADHHQDVMVGLADYVSVMLGRGDGSFQNHIDYMVSRASVTGVALGDFSGHGALDLAAAGGNGVQLLRNNPVIAFFPSNLDFGAQAVGTTSGAQTMTISDPAVANLQLKEISIAGANPGDFSQTSTCGSGLQGGAHCVVTVTFSPQAKGIRTAILQIGATVSGASYRVGLAGLGK